MCQCTADGLNGFMPVVMITVGLTAIIIWKSVYIEKQSFKKKQSSSDAVRIKCMIKKLKSFKYNCDSMKRFLTYQIMKGKKATDQGNVKAAVSKL
ncbi:uncharacterized protein LOC126903614 isoform X2 [Daktulosphaira vitifoliae]|uniref:uncharacterized protein LOC126903614 isoform X2 n=1 Tax=Daktulosphaira vitifoliae TaxID=58002 RepID=UPI0021AA2226|nr:uncharacterized protein LOC126903614 isoform X2 [Daktulosphaira vitifoliae]